MLGRRGGERGSATVFTAVFAIAVIFLLALILDGGSALNAKERAMDIAGQAARAAADTIDLQVLRSSGAAVIGPGACAAAGSLVKSYGQRLGNGLDRVTSTTMVRCTAPPGSDRATVLVSVSTRPLVPGILTAFHESAQASATPECGINQGAPC
jgi:putative Flp pilus-assembly TadE/G-like protein